MRGVDTLHNYLPYPWAYSLLMDLSIGGGGGGVEDKKGQNSWRKTR